MAWQEWCEDSTKREDATTYAADSERQSGFIPGTAIHSSQVNSAIHSNSLIASSLGNVVAPNESIDTSLTSMQTIMSNYFGASIISVVWSNGYLICTKRDGTTFQIQIPTQRGTAMDNPMSASGDLIVGGAGGTPIRRAIGNSGNVLKVVNNAPMWDEDAPSKLKVSGTSYNVTRKALTITENGTTTTYYVADIT